MERKRINWGKICVVLQRGEKSVNHALVHNSSQVYFQLFFVVFIKKSYKSTPLQSIKHLTGNIDLQIF